MIQYGPSLPQERGGGAHDHDEPTASRRGAMSSNPIPILVNAPWGRAGYPSPKGASWRREARRRSCCCFREFIAHAVIGVTLALHAWKTKRF